MENWKLNLDLEQFIAINDSHLFFQEIKRIDKMNSINNPFTYRDLGNHIQKLHIDTETSPVILKINKKITFDQIVNLLALLLKNNQVLITSDQSGDEKLKELEDLVVEIKNQKSQNQKEGAGIYLSTSGSSSKPKIYFFNINTIFLTALSQANALGIEAGDKISCSLPFYHVSGLMTLFRAIVSGASLVQHDLNEPKSFTSIHHISLVPTQILRLESKLQKLDVLASLKSVTIGGAVVSLDLKNRLKKAHIRFFESYGATETLGFALLNEELMPHLQLQLSAEGAPYFYGETLPNFYYQNNIYHSTEHHVRGLTLNDQLEKTTVNLNGEEIYRYRFIKRRDLIFQSAAENISPLEIEEVLQKHFPQNNNKELAFVVTKYPDPEYQWVPILSVISAKDFSTVEQTSLKKACVEIFEQQLLPLKRPRAINFQTHPKFFEEKMSRSQIETLAQQNLLAELFDCELHHLQDKKVTLVFHGFMGQKNDFSFLEDNLSREKFLFTTLPWHKKNKLNSFFFRDTFILLFQVKLLLNIIAKNTLSFSLLGYSMGGRLLLQTLLSFDHKYDEEEATLKKLQQLILVSTGWGLNDQTESEKRKLSDAKLFDHIKSVNDLETFYQSWYQQEIFGGSKRKVIIDEDYKSKALHSYPLINSFQKALMIFGQSAFPLESETISQFQTMVPGPKTTLITGAEDHKYHSLALRLCERLKNHHALKHLSISGAFHDPQRTHPTEFKDIISKLRLDF